MHNPLRISSGYWQFCRQRDGVLKYGSDFLGTFVDVDALEMARRSAQILALPRT
jgi:hypothetical protein